MRLRANILLRLRADWPFLAGRLPFFYGWVIAVVSTLGVLFSMPGQTMGMAVFADAFIEATGLSRTELSFAYMLGTIASSLFLTRAGRLYDAYGPRLLLIGASLLLGTSVAFLSVVDVVSGWLAGELNMDAAIPAFVLMIVGCFGVRFSGQGVMTSASTNMLLVWFERKRGLVTGTRGVIVSLGFSLAPLFLAFLLDSWGWREALWLLAVIVGPGFAILCLLLIRDNPEVCGLRADNQEPAKQDGAGQRAATGFQLKVVRRDPVFWLYSMSLSIHALFGTAVTFHIVAIFDQAGRGREEAFAYFIPQALVSVVTNLGASALADYTRLKPFLLVMLLSFTLGAFGLIYLEQAAGYWGLVMGFGVGGGLWGVLSNLVFIRHYGPKHLGEISGLNAALTVFASAIGPLLFSLAFDITGTFAAGPILSIVALVLLLLAAAVIPQPLDQLPNRLR